MAALPIIMAVASVAQSAVASKSASNLAQAENDAQEANNKSLRQSAANQYSDITKASVDTIENNNLEGIDQQKQYMQAQSRVYNLAGASGTAGGSVDSMLRDLNQTRGQNLTTIQHNRSTQLNEIQTKANQVSYGTQTSSRVFSKPTAFSSIVGAATSGLSAYSAAGGDGSEFSGGG